MESLINASWISIRASDDACFIYSAIFVRLRFEWQRLIITIRKVTIALYAKKCFPPPGFCPGDVSFFVSSLKTPFYPLSPMPRCLKKQTTNRNRQRGLQTFEKPACANIQSLLVTMTPRVQSGRAKIPHWSCVTLHTEWKGKRSKRSRARCLINTQYYLRLEW